MLNTCIPNLIEYGSWVWKKRRIIIYVFETEKQGLLREYFICEVG